MCWFIVHSECLAGGLNCVHALTEIRNADDRQFIELEIWNIVFLDEHYSRSIILAAYDILAEHQSVNTRDLSDSCCFIEVVDCCLGELH
ncbi:hypothetical protein D3C73_1153280 [compost metagenome]